MRTRRYLCQIWPEVVLDVTDHTLLSAHWAPLGLQPGRVLRAFGMRRSGNHAIADWILRNAASQSSVFLNNCAAGTSPLASFRSIEINRQLHPNRKVRADLATACAPVGDGALVLISYEDLVPGKGKRAHSVSGDLPDSAIDADLIIYRGFLNWSASFLRKLQGNPGYGSARRAAVLLRAIDSYSHMLSLVDIPGIVAICYDDWLASPDYRAETLAALGLENRDNSIGQVRPYGGGSSFQKDVSDASELQADRRWQQMKDDPDYRDILRLAARDRALTDQLDRVFAKDAQTLQALAQGGGA